MTTSVNETRHSVLVQFPIWELHDLNRRSLCFKMFSLFEQLFRKTAEVLGNVRA